MAPRPASRRAVLREAAVASAVRGEKHRSDVLDGKRPSERRRTVLGRLDAAELERPCAGIGVA
jgi:hypothetical protein